MSIRQADKESVQRDWPTWPNLKDFNWGLAIGMLFCLLFWAGIVWFVCKLFWNETGKLFRRCIILCQSRNEMQRV